MSTSMMVTLSQSGAAAAAALLIFLLGILLRGGLLLAVGESAWLLYRRRLSAAASHLVLFVALLGLLGLPLLALTVPVWNVRCLPTRASLRRSTPPAVRSELRRSGIAEAISTARIAPAIAARTARTLPIRRGYPIATSLLPSRVPGAMTRVSPYAVAIGIWALGAAVCLAGGVIGSLRLRRAVRVCPIVTEGFIHDLVRDLAARSGTPRPITLRQAAMSESAFIVPMTWGWWRPTLLLPSDLVLSVWPEERLRAAILHELPHVARCDWLTQALTQLVCALHWCDPLTWLLARQISEEAERACDDRVLLSGVRAPDYAAHLVAIIRSLHASSSPVLAIPGAQAMAGRRSRVHERVLSILAADRRRTLADRRLALAALGAGVLVAAPLATVQLSARAEPAGRQRLTSASLAASADRRNLVAALGQSPDLFIRMRGLVRDSIASPGRAVLTMISPPPIPPTPTVAAPAQPLPPTISVMPPAPVRPAEPAALDATAQQAGERQDQANAVQQPADTERAQADAARDQADAAKDQADALKQQADALRQQADAEKEQAEAAEQTEQAEKAESAERAEQGKASVRRQEDAKIGEAATVTVECEAGAISVQNGPAGNVHIDETLNGATVEDLAKLQVIVHSDKDGVHIAFARGAAGAGAGHGRVHLTITAPADAHLDLRTGHGAVAVTGPFTRGLSVQTGGGALAVDGVSGRLQLSTGGGAVSVHGVSGDTEASTGGGAISLDGALSGDDNLRTGGGAVAVHSTADTPVRVDVETGGGAVSVGARLRGDSQIQTGSGSVSITLPADADLSVDATTANGHIASDFSLPIESLGPGAKAAGAVGAGKGGRLTIVTGNGGIQISRRS